MNLEYSYVKRGVSQENIRFYFENGYLIAPDLLSAQEILRLKYETMQILRGNRGYVAGLVKIEGSEQDHEILEKYTAIHSPHKISLMLNNFLFHESVIEILTEIVSPNIKCIQSKLFIKAPGKTGQSWHQDEYYIPTRDKSLTSVWLAFENNTIKNGCLWLIPGSHKPGYIRPRVVNHSSEYGDTDSVNVSKFNKQQLLPIEVKSGSVVFINGYVVHSSQKNKSKNNFPVALVNHYMSAESMLPWDQNGKHDPTDDLRDIIMVAGSDPYEYKGTVDHNEPHLL